MSESEPVTYTYLIYRLTTGFNSRPKLVKGRNPQKAAILAPVNAYAFSYFDIVIADDPLAETKKRLNVSKHYYIDAEIIDIEAARSVIDDPKLLEHLEYLAPGTSIVATRPCPQMRRYFSYNPEQDAVFTTT